MIFNFDNLYKDLIANDFGEWQEVLPAQLERVLNTRIHGKTEEWRKVLSNLPEITASTLDLAANKIQIGSKHDLDKAEEIQLKNSLKQLHPWRKGPYDIFGIHIDTEWHSDWKWQRIQPYISPLKNRSVLDVGCGNGYHMWRMLEEGARLVIGVDPSQFFIVQFQLLKHFALSHESNLPLYILPFKSEELPSFTQQYKGKGFDTVFSMGVLYHRLSPIDHLKELKTFIRSGGELILETLIIESDRSFDMDVSKVLIPEDRYAKMRNVWFLPSPDLLIRMLERAGFINIKVVDINQTSIEEQRSTEWMEFESLKDFLDPDNINKTIEGYPAPKRAMIIANTP